MHVFLVLCSTVETKSPSVGTVQTTLRYMSR